MTLTLVYVVVDPANGFIYGVFSDPDRARRSAQSTGGRISTERVIDQLTKFQRL